MNEDEYITSTFCPVDSIYPVDGIGDVKSNEKGSGARFNGGKPDFSLIPLCTLEDEALVWSYGAKKYSRDNWMKGQAWSVPLGSLLRHLSAWQAGEDIDKESGLSHLGHIACNVRMLILFSKTYSDGDDRAKEWLSGVLNANKS